MFSRMSERTFQRESGKRADVSASAILTSDVLMETQRVGVPTRKVDGDGAADRLDIQDPNSISGHPRCETPKTPLTRGFGTGIDARGRSRAHTGRLSEFLRAAPSVSR